MTDAPKLRMLEWNVRVMMARRKIRTVTDLTYMLSQVGVEISTQQLSRVVNEMPSRLSTELLAGLGTVLDCSVSDLVEFAPSAANPASLAPATPPATPDMPVRQPPKQRKRRPQSAMTDALTDEDIDEMTGPKVHPFPRPKPRS